MGRSSGNSRGSSSRAPSSGGGQQQAETTVSSPAVIRQDAADFADSRLSTTDPTDLLPMWQVRDHLEAKHGPMSDSDFASRMRELGRSDDFELVGIADRLLATPEQLERGSFDSAGNETHAYLSRDTRQFRQ